MAAVQKITPMLWFDRKAEEAVDYYLSIFKNASKDSVTRYGAEGYEIHGMAEGTALAIGFTLEGQGFVALNGGPQFKFTEAVSFVINCDEQEEVDYYWEKLSTGGDPAKQSCGWLQDRFGLSWQVTPRILERYIADKDKAKAGRVMAAMMKMKKIDIAEIEAAYRGEPALS